VLGIIFASGAVWAQVPLRISYQGYLTTATGQQVNSPTTLTLRLYAASTGGAPVWQETHENVPVANGVFTVMLGSLNPLSVTIFDTARYLSVQAGSDAEMTPRQALGSAPFAIQAQQANQLAAGATVQGSQVTGSLSSATVPGSQVSGELTGATIDGAQVTGSLSGSQITGNISEATIAGATLTQLQGQFVPVLQPTSIAANVLTTVDAVGNAGNFYGLASLAIGADGLPVIAYRDEPNGDLKVAHCGNAACSSGNTITTVDSARSLYASLAIGDDGLPVVAYYDMTNFDLKVVHCGNAACSSGNTITTVDSTGDVGAYASLAIGADGLPVIAYTDLTNGDLKIAHCGNAACSSGNTITAVDSTGSAAYYPSITIGVYNTNPVIAYLDHYYSDLKVAKCGDAACSSGNTITTVDSTGATGYYPSITIGADGFPVIAYFDASNGDLKVAKCVHVACTAVAAITTVDSLGGVGKYSSITIGPDGLPVLAYYDETNKNLRFAKCADAACAGASALTHVDLVGDVGMYPSIAIGVDGLPVIAYFDATNQVLKVAKCANAFCAPYFRRR
jgi:hypothetical protein